MLYLHDSYSACENVQIYRIQEEQIIIILITRSFIELLKIVLKSEKLLTIGILGCVKSFLLHYCYYFIFKPTEKKEIYYVVLSVYRIVYSRKSMQWDQALIEIK